MENTLRFLFICTILYLSVIYVKGTSVKQVGIYLLETSLMQVLWTSAYMVTLYSDNQIYSVLLYLIAFCLTVFMIYKQPIGVEHWLATSLIITPIFGYSLLAIDQSPFQSYRNDITIALTPPFLIVINMVSQFVIWSFVKFKKWLSCNPKKEKVPLQQNLTTYLNITGFQVILSVLLESVFIFYNLVLSSIAIILAIVVIFIVRDKLRGNYIFWILSWSAISFLALLVSYACFPYDYSLTLEIRQTRLNCEVFGIIALAIYHVILTIYFRFRAEDQIPEELE